MDTRRLELLVELQRLGSMREVAEVLGLTTSTVSQQLAVLARETGSVLLERDGRRVRLTPAGQRLAERGVGILAEVEAALGDGDPTVEPAGTLRVAGFVTAIRRLLWPVLAELAVTHPSVELVVREHEPAEAFALLATDDIDLALTYDYSLAPARFERTLEAVALTTTPWGLGVPTAAAQTVSGTAPDVFRRFRTSSWIGNSRNSADETVVRTVASMAGFEPRMTHEADSLDLVEDLVVAGLGVGLLPMDRAVRDGVTLVALRDPGVVLRSYAVTRRGRASWGPLALLRERLIAQAS